MESLTAASVAKYHEKTAGNFVSDWAKKNIKIPPKEKALKVLKKYIKNEKDLDDFYAYLPKMMSFLKGKTAMRDPRYDAVFPSGFFKNMIVLVALLSVVGNMYTKERTYDELVKQDIIKNKEVEFPKLLTDFVISDKIIKKVNPNSSMEDMNKAFIDSIKHMGGPALYKIKNVKYPLELKFTRDEAGNSRIFPSQLKKLKDGDKIYVQRQYTPEKYEEIENNLKKIKNEKI